MSQTSFRQARVFAMQILYSMEITGASIGEALSGVLESQNYDEELAKVGTEKQDKAPMVELEEAVELKKLPKESISDEQKKYGMKLVELVLANHVSMDEDIKLSAAHWDIERMARIDRIITRIAMAELLYVPQIPVKVALTEAVQIASKFSTDNSGSFVNGLLAGFIQKHHIVTQPKNKESDRA